MLNSEANSLAEDLLRGADQIGAYVYGDDPQRKRKVYHGYEKGYLPLFKLGGVLHGRRSTIHARFAELEQASSRNEEAA